MDTWRGHFPITHFVLNALLNKRSRVNADGLSSAETVLLSACEFWSAAATRQLRLHLGPDPLPKLLVAFEAFSEIGAVRVASTLRVAVLRAAAGDHNFRHDERILYTVCEFWAAIQARSIVEHLGSRACENVRNAAVAFSAIGATQVGSLLNAVDHDLATAPTRERLLEGLAALEHQLSGALDPVDRLIAGYATAMREGSRTPTSRST